jgi:hypothetical protein
VGARLGPSLPTEDRGSRLGSSGRLGCARRSHFNPSQVRDELDAGVTQREECIEVAPIEGRQTLGGGAPRSPATSPKQYTRRSPSRASRGRAIAADFRSARTFQPGRAQGSRNGCRSRADDDRDRDAGARVGHRPLIPRGEGGSSGAVGDSEDRCGGSRPLAKPSGLEGLLDIAYSDSPAASRP